ncbi:MAG: MerR family transcriptional regulator [Lachnospiraceae bacterium]|nr:MerR family transcriptional regulator [Lachnospiraceae bacterium]
MQKFNVPCIKTGDFAKLCNTNKRTLFHYDEIGLFSPSYTDEKGYRFYTESQCDVFFTITCLKDLGMPLKEIKKYIDHRNPVQLKMLLLEQQKKVQQELKHLQRIEQVIQTKLKLVTSGEYLRFSGPLSSVRIETHPEEFLVATSRLDTDHHEKLFLALCDHISYCNCHHLNTGHPYGAMMSVSALKEGHTETYAHFFTKVATQPDTHSYLTKPAGAYAVIYLKGNYYDADEAYSRLLTYIEENNLTAGEFCYKEAVWDELTVEKEQDYVTRISIPLQNDL